MTAIGKLFVFINLFAAMAILTWATSITVNRLDWVDRKTDSGVVKGQITLLKDDINVASRAITQAQTGYGVRTKRLAGIEKTRADRLEKFEARLTKAKQGTFAEQILMVDHPNPDFRALIDLNQEGEVVRDSAGQPLRGVEALQNDLNREIDLAIEAAKKVQELRKEFETVSKSILEADDKIVVQREILENLRLQEQVLADLQINWDEELRALEVRRKQLESRLSDISER